MDLQERRQLDTAGQVARVRARARPWRSIIAGLLALAAAATASWGHHTLTGPSRDVAVYCGAGGFLLFGLAAVFGLSGKARTVLEPVIGAAHAGMIRFVLLLIGAFAILVFALQLADVQIGQLLAGAAITGVIVGIAAQQSLANMFAGLVLLFASPFRVGDRVRLRAGALAGPIEGLVTDVSITYVRVETADGPTLVPNSQALAAAVMRLPQESDKVETT